MRVQVNIQLPRKLLKLVDRAAAARYTSRSGYVREALVEALKRQGVCK